MGNIGLKQHYETSKKTGALRLNQKNLDELPSNIYTLAPYLRILSISNNKFTRLPDEIKEFTLLKQLNISCNKLATLPESLGSLTKLESLNASSNMLQTIPNSLSKLTHLKQVNLSNNRITEFPLMFCELKHLDVLDLSKNRLTVIPDGASLLWVTELNLNQNQITTISEKLAECSRLKTLRLEENCLQLEAIPTKILKESKIFMLALKGNLFEIKQFADVEGYDDYMERYTAVKKKMF